MWLTADGHLGGAVTLGGCADAHILEALRAVLLGAPAGRLTASLGEDEMYSFGMSCSGSVDVFVEALDFGQLADTELWAALHNTLEADRHTVLVTRLSADGGRWLVGGDGLSVGGAASIPAPVYRAALDALAAPGLPVRLEAYGGTRCCSRPSTPAHG